MVCNFYHWWENKLTLESFYFTHTCFFLKRFTLQNIGVQNILQRMRNTESTKQRRHSDWINGIAEVDVPAQFGPTPLRSGLKGKDAFGRWADLQRFLSIWGCLRDALRDGTVYVSMYGRISNGVHANICVLHSQVWETKAHWKRIRRGVVDAAPDGWII